MPQQLAVFHVEYSESMKDVGDRVRIEGGWRHVHGDLGEPPEKGEVAYPELRVCVEQDADLGGFELMGRHGLEEERHVAEQLGVMHVRLGKGVDDVDHVLRAARNLEVPLAHLLRHAAEVSKHAAVLHAELGEGVDDERDALRGELLLGETRDYASQTSEQSFERGVGCRSSICVSSPRLRVLGKRVDDVGDALSIEILIRNLHAQEAHAAEESMISLAILGEGVGEHGNGLRGEGRGRQKHRLL
mmetsp:Transcript_15435/g.51789  ORF Transcript_15435/g.51789 Transcript_15435/m.51789 type:complete len:245 (+) Transcript_15435:1082-1816(+)